jgi:hypothetical protein
MTVPDLDEARWPPRENRKLEENEKIIVDHGGLPPAGEPRISRPSKADR